MIPSSNQDLRDVPNVEYIQDISELVRVVAVF
jgi:hypothetical protein